MDHSPFHQDEVTAQALAGVHTNGSGIRTFMPDQHRDFFAGLPYLFVSVPDRNGWPLATMLTGPAGFVHAPSATLLRVESRPQPFDPSAPGFIAGNEIGVLGIDFSTRRRNRANGRIAGVDEAGFSVDVAQSFGNCAQYIQTRDILGVVERQRSEPAATIVGLDDRARRLIAEADTFVVASRSRAGAGQAGGLDVSHRGGKPGFVRVERNTLLIPDFKGNRFFNTLGNLLGDNRTGLLFIDFETGDLLSAAGTASIDWHPGTAALPSGAQRYWRVDIERSWRVPGALPFAWRFHEFAPATLATGVW